MRKSRIITFKYRKFFVVDIYAMLTLLGVCFIVLPLFALLPTIRIARLKPIDAIRILWIAVCGHAVLLSYCNYKLVVSLHRYKRSKTIQQR